MSHDGLAFGFGLLSQGEEEELRRLQQQLNQAADVLLRARVMFLDSAGLTCVNAALLDIGNHEDSQGRQGLSLVSSGNACMKSSRASAF